jgi:hypothetical protein
VSIQSSGNKSVGHIYVLIPRHNLEEALWDLKISQEYCWSQRSSTTRCCVTRWAVANIIKALQSFTMFGTTQPTTVSHHRKPISLHQASSVTMKCVCITYKIDDFKVSGIKVLSSHGLLYTSVQLYIMFPTDNH